MKEMTLVLSSMMVAATLTSCGNPWESTDGKGSAAIPGFKVMPGGHCESSAMLNALVNQGYPLTEPMITGAGGALGFGFQKGSFPFISARGPDMREIFFKAAGISWHKAIPKTGDDFGWAEIRSLVERGVPVVLRVDMRYLPYRYGGKYGPAYISFGWHMVTLIGINGNSGTASVSDTELAAPQAIKLADLHKARTSKTKVFPPMAEYYWADPAPSGYALDWSRLMGSAAATVVRNYEEGSLAALEAFPADLEAFESWSKQGFLYPAVLEYMAGNIEAFGTGGASFRILFRDFLTQAAQAKAPACDDFNYARAIASINECISSWHELSGAFRDASKTIKKMTKEEKARTYAGFGKITRRLYEREKTFYNEMKSYGAGD